MRNTLTVEKLKKHVRRRRRGDRSTHTNRTHRVGALPQGHPGLCGTLVGPCRTPTVHQCPPRWRGRGWPKHAPHATPTQKIKVHHRTLIANNTRGHLAKWARDPPAEKRTKPKFRDERSHLTRPERPNDSGATVPTRRHPDLHQAVQARDLHPKYTGR